MRETSSGSKKVTEYDLQKGRFKHKETNNY